MGFVSYLFLGAIAYGAGWAARVYILEKGDKPEQPYGLKHPKIIKILLTFFIIMLIVSTGLGKFALGHINLDIPFILVNSLVATFVFSFGLSPDHVTHDVPH